MEKRVNGLLLIDERLLEEKGMDIEDVCAAWDRFRESIENGEIGKACGS